MPVSAPGPQSISSGDPMAGRELIPPEYAHALRSPWSQQRGQTAPDIHDFPKLPVADPYDVPAYMPRGRFKGQELDLSKRRSVFTLAPEHHERYGVKPGEVAVANFFHKGAGPDRHWVMRYRPEDLIRVTAQQVSRPMFTGHAQVRFDFKPGRGPILVPQDQNSRAKPVRINSFVYSPETAVAKGRTFNIIMGLFTRNSVVAHRFMSLDSIYQYSVEHKEEKIFQYPLRLSGQERRDLLEWYVKRSDREQYTKTFNTLFENCGRNTFDGLNALRPDPYLGVLNWGGFLGAGNGFNTSIMRLLLHSRRLVADHKYPRLGLEFPERRLLEAKPLAAHSGV